jgi:hypothetical protein
MGVGPIRFLYAGLLYVVSFIALFGFLTEANALVKIVWELAYLIIGLLIVRHFFVKKTFGAAAVFYAVNLILIIIAKFFIAGTVLTNVFFVIALVLMAAAFVFSIIAKGKKKEEIQEMPELSIPKIEEAPTIEEITEPAKVEAYGVEKPVKKAAKPKKKTVKKKAKKKKAKKKK